MSLLDALLLDPAPPFEIFIANRTDNMKGSGSASDPYNGSTQAGFDAVMDLFLLQSNVTIHLGPGNFSTAGYDTYLGAGWQLRPGMKILGAGIDVTTLTLMPGASAVHYFAIGHPLSAVADAAEVRDLTIDANLGAAGVTGACGGVRVMGNHARIQRVKVKGWGTRTGTLPCYALSVITAYEYPGSAPVDVANAGMEGCVVVEPHSSNVGPATALNVGGQKDISYTSEVHGKSPYIRNCFVDCGLTGAPEPVPDSAFRALSMGWCRGGVVEGNHVHNTDIAGPYQDLRSVRDLIVRNNFYKNVARGPYLNLGQLGTSITGASLSRSGAVATISTGAPAHNLLVGDRVTISGTPADFNGVYQVRSVPTFLSLTISVADAGATSATVTVTPIRSVGRAVIEGNLIELATGPVAGVAVEVADNNASSEGPDYFHGEIIVRNNKVRYVDGALPADGWATLVKLAGAKAPIVRENILDTIATQALTTERCGPGTFFNNRAVQGSLLLGLNKDTNRHFDELETEVEDAFVMALLDMR